MDQLDRWSQYRSKTPDNGSLPGWEMIVDVALKNQLTSNTTGLHPQSKMHFSPSADELSDAVVKSQTRLAAYLERYDEYLSRQANSLARELRLNQKEIGHVHCALLKLTEDFQRTPLLTGADIGRAHLNAQKKLLELRQTFVAQHPLQIFSNSDQKICILMPAPPISNLVFKGGGVRGQSYVAVLNVLETCGLTRDLRSIAGTSAGALTAACLATGISAERFAQLTKGLDMKDQLGDAEESDASGGCNSTISSPIALGLMENGQYGTELAIDTYSGLGSSVLNSIANKPAKKLLRTFQQVLRENVRAHFTSLLINQSPLPAEQKELLLKLDAELQTHKSYQVTFSDLALLHQFDPAHFKLLVLTGFNETDKKLEIFDAQTTPHLPIASAMRASMAIPKLIAPVNLILQGKSKTVVDGGVGTNVPSHLLNDYAHGGKKQNNGLISEDMKEQMQRAVSFAQTMVLSFDDNGTTAQLLSSTPAKLASDSAPMEDRLIEISGINPSYIASVTKPDNLRVHEAGLNAYIVYNGELSLASFNASRAQIKAAQLEAEVRFFEQIRANGLLDNDRAICLTFDSMEEASAHIDEASLRAFINRKSGWPSSKSDKQLTLEAAFDALARKRLSASAEALPNETATT
ncbi:patatin-like phospholipase family protein|uniref:patatin-like phospholipase family protein n=1 Tax=Noviherbaspirillum sp. L7-7A TaxID=2850560 RepID=UPI001C2BF4A0|nr:patatin-like phospholipase family protein [Noviherbaspirillum sp. L7-7A]MBV0879555.1 patatin-like phospholipase family protein [Noviherbaspirillum sp. L7-7A]